MAEETNPTPEIDYKAEYEKTKSDYEALKRNFDKASSEIAEFKRKDRARMTDDEKRNAELAEREEHYKAIERENALYKYKASLSTQIKDEKVLSEVAEMYANGDISGAITKQNEYFAKFHDELEKSIKADLLKQNPQPTPQTKTPTKSFREMTLDEKSKLHRENPELYEKLKNSN